MSARNFVARPESVTVIAWLLIIFGAFGMMGSLAAWSMRDMPTMQPMLALYKVPFTVIMAVGMVNVTIHLLCAVGLLLRQSWARHVYVVTAVLATAFAVWTSPWPQFVLPSLLLPVAATVFLYRPAANRWFASDDVTPA